MNTEALFVFLILLLGLLLCSFLGGKCGNEGFTTDFSGTFTINQPTNSTTSTSGTSTSGTSTNATSTNATSTSGTSTNGASTSSPVNYDNYNHYSGSSTQLASGTTFYGQNGGSVVVKTNSDGTQSLQVTLANGQQPMTFTVQPPSSSPSTSQPPQSSTTTTESYTNYYGNNGTATTYYGPNGSTATVASANNGQQAINVQTPNGSYTFTQSGSYYNPDNTSSTQYYGSTGYHVDTYQGAYGGSAGAVTGPQGNTAYYAQGPNGNTVAGTTSNTSSSSQYYGPYGGSAGAVTGPQGNTAYYAQGPNGNGVAGSNYDYSSSLPQGIPASQIPSGQEDLYILKSQVVPPVCPAPTVIMSDPNKEAKCGPCPITRCPAEPNFECKKVPNYNAIDNLYLPQPVLNDFSTFGM